MQTHDNANTHTTRLDVAADSRSAVDLLRDLRDEMTLLLRKEVELAKTEVTEKVTRVSRNAAYVAVGGLVTFAGVMILLLAAVAGLYVVLWAVAGLSNATAGWLSPLIVGGLVAIVGYISMHSGLSTLRHEPAMPQRTVDSMRENKDWVKEKVS